MLTAIIVCVQASVYQSDFRPVPLEEFVSVGRDIYTPESEWVRTLKNVDIGGRSNAHQQALEQDCLVELCKEVREGATPTYHKTATCVLKVILILLYTCGPNTMLALRAGTCWSPSLSYILLKAESPLCLQRVLHVRGCEQRLLCMLQVVREGNSVLIFCPTKLGCEKTARLIATRLPCAPELRPILSSSGGEGGAEEEAPASAAAALEELARGPAGLDDTLAEALPSGVAYHHAGLTVMDLEHSLRNNQTLKP